MQVTKSIFFLIPISLQSAWHYFLVFQTLTIWPNKMHVWNIINPIKLKWLRDQQILIYDHYTSPFFLTDWSSCFLFIFIFIFRYIPVSSLLVIVSSLLLFLLPLFFFSSVFPSAFTFLLAPYSPLSQTLGCNDRGIRKLGVVSII